MLEVHTENVEANIDYIRFKPWLMNMLLSSLWNVYSVPVRSIGHHEESLICFVNASMNSLQWCFVTDQTSLPESSNFDWNKIYKVYYHVSEAGHFSPHFDQSIFIDPPTHSLGILINIRWYLFMLQDGIFF